MAAACFWQIAFRPEGERLTSASHCRAEIAAARAQPIGHRAVLNHSVDASSRPAMSAVRTETKHSCSSAWTTVELRLLIWIRTSASQVMLAALAAHQAPVPGRIPPDRIAVLALVKVPTPKAMPAGIRVAGRATKSHRAIIPMTISSALI